MGKGQTLTNIIIIIIIIQHSVEEGQAENIMLDEPVHCTLSAGQYRHFVLVCMHTRNIMCVDNNGDIHWLFFFFLFSQLCLPPQSQPSRLTVEVKKDTGDPDLFLCQNCSVPSQSRCIVSSCDYHVTFSRTCSYMWCCQDTGDSVIVLSEDDKDYKRDKVSPFLVIIMQ